MSRKLIQALLRQPRGPSPKRKAEASLGGADASDAPGGGSGRSGGGDRDRERRRRRRFSVPVTKWGRTLFPDWDDDRDVKPSLLLGAVGTLRPLARDDRSGSSLASFL